MKGITFITALILSCRTMAQLSIAPVSNIYYSMLYWDISYGKETTSLRGCIAGSGGIQFCYGDEHLGLSLGLLYESYSGKEVVITPYEEDDHGYGYGSSYYQTDTYTGKKSQREEVDYLSFPAALAIKVEKEKSGFYANLGAELQMPIAHRDIHNTNLIDYWTYDDYYNNTHQEGKNVIKEHSVNPDREELRTNLGLLFELGAIIPLNKKISLYAGYHMSAGNWAAYQRESKSSFNTPRTLAVGLNLSLRYVLSTAKPK